MTESGCQRLAKTVIVDQSSVSMASGAVLDDGAGAEGAFDFVPPLPCLVLRKV